MALTIDVQPGAVSPAFYPYLLSRARFRLFWGGRDGTKSDFYALDLLLQCLGLPYFKCILIRKVFNTIAESQIATLRKVAEREGLLEYFEFRASPLMIKCTLNSNSFICRGLDDPARLKSVSDPTHAWYEEANQISQEEANYVSTSLRSSDPGAVIQEGYTFNPDHEGDYKSFWLWKKFFEATGHANDLTFAGRLAVDVNGQLIEQRYEVLHTTYRDNPWCPPERAATYEAYATTDPYRHRVWALGLWSTKQSGNEFYPAFSRAAHVAPVAYQPGTLILQSWDANALPYCAMLCAQPVQQGGQLRISIFHEYALRPPNSGLASTATRFLLDRQENQWTSSDVQLTGDASLRARKTGDGNQSNFKDIEAAMHPALDSNSMKPWPHGNTRVGPSRDFVNYVLRGGLPHVAVVIDPGCTECIADLELSQLGADGGVFKELYTEKDTGLRYQLRGHFSDVLRYLVVTLLKAEYDAFLKMRPQ